jgi:hypothetical protein
MSNRSRASVYQRAEQSPTPEPTSASQQVRITSAQKRCLDNAAGPCLTALFCALNSGERLAQVRSLETRGSELLEEDTDTFSALSPRKAAAYLR